MEPKTLHRRLIAALAGVAVAALAVVACAVLLPAETAGARAADYGYVYSGTKAAATSFVREGMAEDSLLVLGSSEFSTPASTVPQVPANTFGTHDYGMRLMLVGEAFDQALWHAMAMGAYAREGVPRNKVALIIGLGQYTDAGLDPSSFQERFSWRLYREFCRNDAIDEGVKSYVRRRLREFGIAEHEIQAPTRANAVDAMNDAALDFLSDLRLRKDLDDVRSRGIPFAAGPVEAPDWERMMAEARTDAAEMGSSNAWGAENAFYTEQLAPALDSLAGARADETYQKSQEYGDLKCFLDVCDFCGIEPLIIIEPVMGPYYDHIGIGRETREAAYARIRDVVAAHPAARLCDFTDHEYEPGFLFDIVHFGWCGWVSCEHALWDFWQEG